MENHSFPSGAGEKKKIPKELGTVGLCPLLPGPGENGFNPPPFCSKILRWPQNWSLNFLFFVNFDFSDFFENEQISMSTQ